VQDLLRRRMLLVQQRTSHLLSFQCLLTRQTGVGNFSSYCRCVKADWTSNGKVKGKGNRKNGNKYLAWAFVEASNFARRHCRAARAYYQRKKSRTNAIVATKVLANKLCKACYFILKNQEAFEVEKIFGPNAGDGGEPAKGLVKTLQV